MPFSSYDSSSKDSQIKRQPDTKTFAADPKEGLTNSPCVESHTQSQAQIDDQRRLLNSPVIQTHVRQKHARQIAQLQGNSHLNRVLEGNGFLRGRPEQSSGADVQRDVELPLIHIAGDPQFYSRALRNNRRYSHNPSAAGWPYDAELDKLWHRQAYDEFAERVRDLQEVELGLVGAEADGILGPQTARLLQKRASENGENVDDQSEEQEPSSLDPNTVLDVEDSPEASPPLFTEGQLTMAAEGEGPVTLAIHWPGTENSGVTIGYGYDMGTRGREQIISELTAADVSPTQARELAGAAHLRGTAAREWKDSNRSEPWATINEPQRRNLFQQLFPNYQNRARRLATSTTPTAGNRRINAASRDPKNLGFVIPTERWNQLHPAIVELLTDMSYVGIYSYSRHETINPILMNEELTTIQQLQQIRPTIQTLPLKIQKPHRRRLRLDFIDRVISGLQSQQNVEF